MLKHIYYVLLSGFNERAALRVVSGAQECDKQGRLILSNDGLSVPSL